MSCKRDQIDWVEEMNGVKVDCSLDIAIHSADSNIILLTIPGVDGSVDGYKNKYISIAEGVQAERDVAVVRMANPFISSFHWESNIRRAMEYIRLNMPAISASNDAEIRVMAHSAGAAIIAQIAWEFPEIKRLLLVNPAANLGVEKIQQGLAKFNGDYITVLYGSLDSNIDSASAITETKTNVPVHTFVLDGIDHHISGDRGLIEFIAAPNNHLFI